VRRGECLSSLLILIASALERRFAPGAPPGTLRAWPSTALAWPGGRARTDSALFAAAYVTLGIRAAPSVPAFGAALAVQR